MAELPAIDKVIDTWVNGQSSPDRQSVNYVDANHIQLESGERFGFVWPQLPNLAGATIVDAYLVGRSSMALAAQDITVRLVSERYSPGRVNWTNKPSTTASPSATTTIAGTSGAGETVELTGLGPLIQLIADGTDWYGFRLTTDETSGPQRFRSTESGNPAWELHITVSDVPEIPSNLRPDGGAVSSATPIVAWDFLDFGEDVEQAQSRVQVDTPTGGADPDEVAPDYDSGWQANVDPEWALSGRHTLTGGGPHYWRVNTEDGDGNESGWSDWAEFTVAAKPSLVLDAPTGGAIGDPSPTVLAHLSSGTLSHWQAKVTGADRSDVRARTGMQTGAISWQVPTRFKGRRVIREGKPAWLHVRAWDTEDRAVAVGDSAYVETWVELTFSDDVGVVAPTGLSVTQAADGDPRHTWSWTCGDVPDAFLIQVDGVTVERIPGDELTPSGGVYTWTDAGHVPPMRPHTLGVRAANNGNRSTAATTAHAGHTVKGLWLLHDDIDPVQLSGESVGGWTHSDRVATYAPLNGPEVDVIYGHVGRVGTFEGSVDSRQDDVWATLDRLHELRTSKVRTVRMVWGSESVNVRLRDVSPTPDDKILPNNLLHVVRFGFVEVD